MFRIGVVLICMALIYCKNKKDPKKEESSFSYEDFSNKFRKGVLPLQISDTGFLKNKTEAASIAPGDLNDFIGDSIYTRLFGTAKNIKFFPYFKFQKQTGETYFILSVTRGLKKTAYLFVFNKKAEFGGAMPFFNPDEHPHGFHTSILDKSFSITKKISKKGRNEVVTEGKEVYQLNSENKKFLLVMTDIPDAGNQSVLNPIDSLSRKNRLSGDYIINKNNFVSVRDGRHPNQLVVFIHFEREDPPCSGELKGDILLTAPNAAIYRQGSDPCVMSFNFNAGTLTIGEDEGCGNHRGVDCVFEGNYIRKKELKIKAKAKKRLTK